MTTAFEMLQRLRNGKKPSEIFAEVAQENEGLFAEMNRKQLLAGRDINGNYLPRYTDDVGVYFKTIEGAKRYELWKQGISPDKSKPSGVMDFYIDGTYNRDIISEVRNMDLTIRNPLPYAPNIDSKTNNKALGVNPETAKAIGEILQPEVIIRLSEQTGAIKKNV